jgi:DNA adenine methylase
MNGPSRLPHPIPYQGSKRNLAPAILSHVPAKVTRLVEPFAGSAAISIAAAHRGIAASFWINDAHGPIIALWKEIINRPESISKKYRHLWDDQCGQEREYFDKVRSAFNRSQQPEHFLYLLARCVKAAIRYNSNGEFNNTPDNRRKGAKPKEMDARIHGASAYLRGKTVLTSLDYRDVLNECEPDDLIYMDPPYQGVCGNRDNRYLPKVCHDQFQQALGELNDRGCLYIVSYDGRTGDKQHGRPLPKRLGLKHLELCAGRSTQATLLGLDHITYESLYLSPALADALQSNQNAGQHSRQMTLV